MRLLQLTPRHQQEGIVNLSSKQFNNNKYHIKLFN